MTPDEAQQFLDSIGYVRGRDGTAEPKFAPHRDRIKDACRVLREAELRGERPPAPDARPPRHAE